MTQEVWAFSESDAVANETLTAANEIANAISGTAVMIEVQGGSPGKASFGRKLLLKGTAASADTPEFTAEVMARAAKQANPAVILVGGTKNGREVSARLSARLSRGCLSDVSKLSSDGRTLSGERGEYAGKVQTRVAADLPCIATVKAGAYPPATGKGGEVSEVQVGEVQVKEKVLSVNKKVAAMVDLRAAKIIVSAGRGVKKKEDLAIIESLARALGGTMGCSRPLSSDLGWLPEDYHIGLTGLNVKPDLYLAVGISGQLQHVAGIKDSKVVAAINTDKEAPIFQAADYGVVGDLYQVVPALEKALASRGR
ncbi:MAG TPA: electron transfer flavoprotein subunit alpha/FixB family protein [Nitrososphaerales archaeon]|nr:electron transfer flavoprotein subunit alpha/FixB family protein [Nitrososphaerales archaeon]